MTVKSFIDVFYHQIRNGIQGYTARAPPLSRGVGFELAIKRSPARRLDHSATTSLHCSQGSTFDFDYSIYEWQCFTKEMMYVAISRATKRSLINFCNTDYKLNDVYIYKVSNLLTNKSPRAPRHPAEARCQAEAHRVQSMVQM